MTRLARQEFTANLLTLLSETFEAGGRFYLDKGAGLFGTLETITAEVASREPSPGAPSIAAHCAHLDYYVRANHNSIVGRAQELDCRRAGGFTGLEFTSGRPSRKACVAGTKT